MNHAEHCLNLLYTCIYIGKKSNDVMHPNYTPSIFSFSSGSKGYDRYARSASRQSKRFKPNIEPSVPSSSADDDMTLPRTTDMQQSGMSHCTQGCVPY